MLKTIRRSNRSPEAEDVSELLLSCHQRIRHFSALAVRLGDEEAAPEERVAEAAAAVHRYFHVALPLHVADEDLSLAPRLLSVGVPAEVREALDAMAAEHPAIEAAIAQAAPLWTSLVTTPARRGALRDELARAGRHLELLFERHLLPEETTIFPALRRHLDPGQLEDIVREMRLRREAPSS